MNCLFQVYSTVLFSRAGYCVGRTTVQAYSTSLWKRKIGYIGANRATNFESFSQRFRVQCYSSQKSGRKSVSRPRKSDTKPVMKDEKDAFFVVRKGDTVGVYKSLSDCQAQVGTSICDPPVSVFKGYSLPRETQEYLASQGLKNALYSIRAADLKEGLFGMLAPCLFQQLDSLEGQISQKDPSNKRLQEETVEPTDVMRKHARLDQQSSCFLEFDGASKGNPGLAGAGAVLRSVDGSVICRLREGLGKVTNNVAEYRALILGMKYALKKGYTHIQVQGDSKLVCMQVQDLWKAKHQGMSELCEEAKKLKSQFLCFKIKHVLRGLNSEADAQANLATDLADGQVHEELEK